MFKKLFTFSIFFFLFYIFNVNFFTEHNGFIFSKQANALDTLRKSRLEILNTIGSIFQKDKMRDLTIPDEMRYCVALKNDKGNILYPPSSRKFNAANGGILLPAQLVGINAGNYRISEPFLAVMLSLIIGFFVAATVTAIVVLSALGATVTAASFPEAFSLSIVYGSILIFHIMLFSFYSFYYIYFFRNIAEIGQSLVSKVQNKKSGDSDDTNTMAELGMLAGEIFGVSAINMSAMYNNTSSITNIVKDKELQSNSYCYAINGSMETSSDLNNLVIYPEIPFLDRTYNQYPIYPIKNVVTKGQCDPAPLLNDLDMLNSDILDPFDSRCTYSYNTTNQSCVTQNIPTIILGAAQKMAISYFCDDLFETNPLTSVFFMVFTIVMGVLDILFSPLSLDPLMMYDYYAISSIPYNLLLSFTIFVQTIIDTVTGGNYKVKPKSFEIDRNATKKAQKKAEKQLSKYIEKLQKSTNLSKAFDPKDAIKSVTEAGIETKTIETSVQFGIRIGICLGTQVTTFGLRFATGQATLRLMQIATKDTFASNRNAKYGIENIKFCGHDFYSYKGVSNKTEEDLTKDIKLFYEGNSMSKEVVEEKKKELLYNSIVNNKENNIYEYFERGIYENSYAYCLGKCLDIPDTEKLNGCKTCLTKFFKHPSFLTDIKYLESDKTKVISIQNRFYREFQSEGVEYKIPTNINGEEDALIHPNNHCIDPRIQEEKGFDGLEQRYYFRGNEEANFECDRFMFYKNRGCILSGDEIESSQLKYFDKVETLTDSKTAKKQQFYVLKNDLEKNNLDYNLRFNLLNTYKEHCIAYFNNAYQCCLKRHSYTVCLEDSKTLKKGNKEPKIGKEYNICISEEEIDQEALVSSLSIFSLISNAATKEKAEKELNAGKQFYEAKCRLGSTATGLPTADIDKIHFNVIKKSLESPDGELEARYACVFSDNLCPYNFRLNGGLNYPASYCDSGNLIIDSFGPDMSDGILNKFKEHRFSKGRYEESSSLCKNGMFNQGNCLDKDLTDRPTQLSDLAFGNSKLAHGFAFAKVASDMRGFNDNDYEKINGESFKTANVQSFAKGKIKNFCQFRAHCIKLGNPLGQKDEYGGRSIFTDSSCNKKYSSSRNNSNNGATRLTSAVVECLHETLQNLVNGVAGASSCKPGLSVNEEGYCGSDTEDLIKEKIETKNNTYIDNRYKILKGNKVPKEKNPLFKLQINLVQIVRAVLALSIAIWGFRTIVFGEYNLQDYKSYLTYIPNIIKIGIVMYFGFGSGWQDGNYNKLLTNFTTDAYTFVSRLVNASIDNPHYNVLTKEIIETKNDKGDKIITMRPFEFSFSGNAITSSDTANSVISQDKLETFCYKEYAVGKLIKATSQENSKKAFVRGGIRNTYYFAEYSRSEGKCPDKSFEAVNSVKISSNQGINSFIYFIEQLNKKTKKGMIGYSIFYKNNNTLLKLYDNDKIIWNKQYDGCYFDEAEYKANKSYLSIFDTIDCKIVNYLGFKGGTSIPNILMFALACLFTGFLGSFLLGFVMSLIFGLLHFMLEAIYIFINSFFMTGLLILMSPIIVPLVMFKKTKKIFDQWLNKIMHCALQPLLMIATMLVFLSALDIITLSGMQYTDFSDTGRVPSLDTKVNTNKYNYFYIINHPGLIISATFDLLFSVPFQAIGAVLGTSDGGMEDILNTPIISYMLTILQILVLFKIGDSLIKTAGDISEKLVGGSGAGGGTSIAEGMNKGKQAAQKAEGAVKPLKENAKNMAKTGAKATMDKIGRTEGGKAMKGFFGKMGSGLNTFARQIGSNKSGDLKAKSDAKKAADKENKEAFAEPPADKKKEKGADKKKEKGADKKKEDTTANKQ